MKAIIITLCLFSLQAFAQLGVEAEWEANRRSDMAEYQLRLETAAHEGDREAQRKLKELRMQQMQAAEGKGPAVVNPPQEVWRKSVAQTKTTKSTGLTFRPLQVGQKAKINPVKTTSKDQQIADLLKQNAALKKQVEDLQRQLKHR